MSTASDAGIVQAVLSGEREQFGELVERHLPAVYAIACARLRNATDAEDVAQETFLNAYKHLGSLRQPEKFEGWVAKIARNTAAGFSKRRSRERDAVAGVDRQETAPPSDAARVELARAIRAAVDELNAGHREVVLLHYFAGKTTREVADVLGVSQAAVKKRLQRAREALGEELLGRLAEEGDESTSLTPLAKTITGAIAAGSAGYMPETAVAAAAGATWMKALAVGGVAVAVGGAVAFGVATFSLDDGSVPVAGENVPEETQEGAGSGVVVAPDHHEPPDEGEATSDSTAGETPPAAAGSQQTVESEPERTSLPYPGPGEELSRLLKAKISVVFEDIELEEMIGFMAKTYDMTIYLDARVIADAERSKSFLWFGEDVVGSELLKVPAKTGYVTDGMFDKVDLIEVTLAEALTELLSPHGLDYIVEPGFVWVSSPQRIAREVETFEPDRFEGYDLVERLNRIVNLRFEDVHLIEILEFLTETYEVNIVADTRVVQPQSHAGEPSPNGDAAADAETVAAPESSGVVTDGVTRYINLRGVQMRDALRGILRPLNLSYVATGNEVWVSTPGRIAAGDIPIAGMSQ